MKLRHFSLKLAADISQKQFTLGLYVLGEAFCRLAEHSGGSSDPQVVVAGALNGLGLSAEDEKAVETMTDKFTDWARAGYKRRKEGRR